MAVEIIGLENLTVALEQVGVKAVAGAIVAMRKEAETVAEYAREYAPLDEGNLEKAIKVRETGGGRNELGQFARKGMEVYVDQSMPVPERPGKTVGDYAYEVHEHMEPTGGPKKRGPLSEQKDGGRNVVGGGYMTRAAKDAERHVMEAVAAAVRLSIS
jgi:hypothetical protein